MLSFHDYDWCLERSWTQIVLLVDLSDNLVNIKFQFLISSVSLSKFSINLKAILSLPSVSRKGCVFSVPVREDDRVRQCRLSAVVPYPLLSCGCSSQLPMCSWTMEILSDNLSFKTFYKENIGVKWEPVIVSLGVRPKTRIPRGPVLNRSSILL